MTGSIQAFLAAFLASTVELVEALTIVLAAGATRGWNAALGGAAAGLLVLGLALAVFGRHLASLNTPAFKLIMGSLLLLFGLRWLRKAILRSAGVIAMHDEAKAFAAETAALSALPVQAGWDMAGAATAFNGVLVEGLEVIFIVFAVGSTGPHMGPALVGAVAAAVVVLAAGIALRRPLTRVPENALKMVVAVLVSSFGTLWVGEGLRLSWPGEDWSLLCLSAFYALTAVAGVTMARLARAGRSSNGEQA